VVVGDDGRDFDNHVPFRFQAGHFKIYPHEHVARLPSFTPSECAADG
jgi:hypothetical protein